MIINPLSPFQFGSKRKMGGDEFSERYREKLEQDLEEAFGNFRAHNESKNIFKAARTPAVFFGIAVIMYMLSGIFGLFGIYTLANSSNLLMGIALLTLMLWAYIRYSGELSDFGCQLDTVADYVWENVSVRRGMKWVIFRMFGLWRRLLVGGGRTIGNVCPLKEAAGLHRRGGIAGLAAAEGRRMRRGGGTQSLERTMKRTTMTKATTPN